ncbi:hypothetical protein GJ744_000348 [Endocarpon pusillum]|uniref:Uncharacterized protein n=1 Tax=Endocarpon pusillum TaxID=364733 RepID=A0A8H7ATL7_9EURO|nr:hypothetical protein GJ744_000348 [Endocarpon pusillum]
MAARSNTADSRPSRFNRSSVSDSRSSSESSTTERSLLTSSLTSLRGSLRRNNSEKKDPQPTVYLIIQRPEPRNVGISWTIAIRVPEGPDYMFDILPSNKTQKGFHVREMRVADANMKSEFFKATIKVGIVPINGPAAEHSLGHVANSFKSHKISTDKPNGMSVIWVTDVLDKLKRTEFLHFERGANEKIEEQIRNMEKKLKADSSAGRS